MARVCISLCSPSPDAWILMAGASYKVLLVVSFCCSMLYYSLQVLWPRQSSLLFASAEQPIMRGVYANLTILGTWGRFHHRLLIACSLLNGNSLAHLRLGHLCKTWSREVADPGLHLHPDCFRWLSFLRRGNRKRQSCSARFSDVLFHQPVSVLTL